ncbi:MAG: glycerol-3-phosphate 1-O-acyltransferase PlsY [Firmicutes bacterium]|nr:glycerol-3-phosphate 1-O-acyltransferase PlsY [Bacillota bacterium]
MLWITWVVLIIGGYLLGSIPAGYVLVKLKKGIDIRRYGSGNIGSTNTVRVAGAGTGALVFAIDVAKGAVPALLGLLVCEEAALLAGLAAFIGHLWPIWLGFSGGKGVATGFGVGIVIAPILSLIVIAVWLVVAVVTGYVSVASCSASILLLILLICTGHSWVCIAVFTVIVGLICWRHKKNFQNIRNGTEGKSFRKHK